MKKVSPNIIMWIFRSIILASILAIGIVISSRIIRDGSQVSIKGFIFTIAFLLFVVFLMLSMFGIFKIRYSESTHEIVFYQIHKIQSIRTNELKGYYISNMRTRWKEYVGYIFQLKNGKTIEISEYNVKSLRDFYSFIVKSDVRCLGTKNSWFPLKRRLLTT